MRHFASILVLILIHSAAWGDPGPLVSSKKEFHKGKFLLVMVYPKENSLNENNPLNKMYPQSGLYRNDGERKPIWTLPGAFQGQTFLSADGDFLAHIVFSMECDGDGVHFYHKGKLIRAHKITDLTRPDSVQKACPSCIWHGKVEFNEADETFTLDANDGRVWRFDLRTGDAVVVRGGAAVLPLVGGGGPGASIYLIVALVFVAGMAAFALIAAGGVLALKFGISCKVSASPAQTPANATEPAAK